MSTSFVQAEKLRPTPFEVEYFDQYDFYSLTDRYSSKWTGRDGWLTAGGGWVGLIAAGESVLGFKSTRGGIKDRGCLLFNVGGGIRKHPWLYFK